MKQKDQKKPQQSRDFYNFYIGWQEKQDAKVWLFLRKPLRFFCGGIVLFLAVTLLLQKPFNNHQFEFTNLLKYKGLYFDYPLPSLVLTEPEDLKNQFPVLLLVGYGKNGAEKTIEAIEKKMGESLNGKLISMRGKLIYGNNQALLELDDAYSEDAPLPKVFPLPSENFITELFIENTTVVGVDSQLKPKKLLHPTNALQWIQLAQEIQKKPKRKLRGEILDPKCYFGVMKPGDGILHKSCAIRCLSGGIPPVFRVSIPSGHAKKERYSFYILLGHDGRKINEQILPYVAESSQISGHVLELKGWNFFLVDNPKNIRIFR